MHELGVVFHIMDSLEKVAQENEVMGISKVVLELGEVSTVIEDYLQNCWKWAAKKRELFAFPRAMKVCWQAIWAPKRQVLPM